MSRRWRADAAAPLRFGGLRGRVAQTDRWKWHLNRLITAEQALADSFAGQRPEKFGKPALLPCGKFTGDWEYSCRDPAPVAAHKTVAS